MCSSVESIRRRGWDGEDEKEGTQYGRDGIEGMGRYNEDGMEEMGRNGMGGTG